MWLPQQKMSTILDQFKNEIYEFSDLVTKINITKTCKFLMEEHGYEYDAFINIKRMQRKYLFKACDRGQLDLVWSLVVGDESHYASKIAQSWFPKMVDIQICKNLAPYPGHKYGTPGPTYIKQKYMDYSNIILNMHTYFTVNNNIIMEMKDEKFAMYIRDYLLDMCIVSNEIIVPQSNIPQMWDTIFKMHIKTSTDDFIIDRHLAKNGIKYICDVGAFALCGEEPQQIYDYICRNQHCCYHYFNTVGLPHAVLLEFIENKFIGFSKILLTDAFRNFINDHHYNKKDFIKDIFPLFSKWTTHEIMKNIEHDLLVRKICFNKFSVRRDYIKHVSNDKCDKMFLRAVNLTTAKKLYESGKVSAAHVKIRSEKFPNEKHYWESRN